MIDEKLINRARMLLAFLSREEAFLKLKTDGIPSENAYLAIVAAQICLRD